MIILAQGIDEIEPGIIKEVLMALVGQYNGIFIVKYVLEGIIKDGVTFTIIDDVLVVVVGLAVIEQVRTPSDKANPEFVNVAKGRLVMVSWKTPEKLPEDIEIGFIKL